MCEEVGEKVDVLGNGESKSLKCVVFSMVFFEMIFPSFFKTVKIFNLELSLSLMEDRKRSEEFYSKQS